MHQCDFLRLLQIDLLFKDVNQMLSSNTAILIFYRFKILLKRLFVCMDKPCDFVTFLMIIQLLLQFK